MKLTDRMKPEAFCRSTNAGPVEQSFAQGRLWFLNRLYPDSTWYLVPLALRMQGPLQLAALNAALLALEERHESLRTTFDQLAGVDVQLVQPPKAKHLHATTIPINDETSLFQALHRDWATPFDLADQPGWRVSIYQLGEEEHVLSIVMHHIISDGWSLDILERELATFYSAAIRGQDPLSTIDPLPIQYRDFSVWQKQQEQAEEHQRQLEYWIKQLQGSRPAELLCDNPRPTILSGKGDVQEIAIQGSLYQSLHHFCKAHQVTPFVTLLAAFRAAFYRMTGVEDATIGTLIANRNRQELEGLIGFFVNLQCIRSTVQGESFGSLVQQIRSTVADAHANQDVPFERIVADLQSEARDASRNPVVQTVFSVHSEGNSKNFTLEDLEVERMPFVTTSRFDLEFHLFQGEDKLDGSILFATELYEPATINSLVSTFYELLERGLKEPQTPIASLALSNGHSILHKMGLVEIERTDYPRDSSVVDVFRSQAAISSSKVAVKDSTTELTYAQLHEKSDELASWLRRRGLAPESLIGVFAPRSCETVVAFLGILKANLAYLPLDVKVPKARNETILSSITSRKLVLTGCDIPTAAIQCENVEVVPIAEALGQFTETVEPATDAIVATEGPSATSLAYVMFTSGSTGRPKGVMIEHRGIVRLVKHSNVVADQDLTAPVAHLSNIAFDASTWEVYSSLLNGGTLVCIDTMTMLDIVALEKVFCQENIRAALFTPAFLKQCLATTPAIFSQLDSLFSAGDRLSMQDAIKAARLVRGSLINAYGPTENTSLSTIYRIPPNGSSPNGIPIGRAVSNSGAYVMDQHQRLVPLGIIGELVVTGDGVARGYTDPERNHNRFTRVTINGQSMKAYRTGDYARYRPVDGQLEFFGRMDFQVKIRGHRVELPEVEHALLADESVSDAVVLVRGSEGEDPELVSFVTVFGNQRASETGQLGSDGDESQAHRNGHAEPYDTDPPLDTRHSLVAGKLRQQLQSKLPSYMVPSVIHILDRMPINANGKVDRQVLTENSYMLAHGRKTSTLHVPPRNDVERIICEEFGSMLGTDVGITDSFFDLGGHSLLAAGLVFRLNKRLTHKTWVYDLMQSPTPASLSEIIATRSNSAQNAPAHLETHSRPNSRLTLVLVHGLWGQGSIFLPLVETLDKALDVLLLHDPFFGKPDCPNTVIEWAEFYLQDVLNQIPEATQ
jgi:amino acid adenylation domain-containing protein